MLQDYPISPLEVVSTMIQAAPFPGYFCSGHNLVITFANEATFKAWGKDDTIIGLPLAQVFSNNNQAAIEAAINTYTTGIPSHAQKEPLKLEKEGLVKTYYFDTSYQPFYGDGGKITGIFCWANDVTALVTLQMELQTLEQTHPNATDVKALDVITIASHEFKTPLTTVKSYIQLLLERAQKEDDNFKINALTRVERQANIMSTLIENLLNDARISDGKLTLTKNEFNVHELLIEIIEDARLNFQTHEIIMNECENAFVYADRNKIAQVLGNLINNAVKYSPKGSVIIIGCKSIDENLEISVSDSGIGISTKDQEDLFKRFYRVVNQQTKNVSGFGIGLYLTAEILRYHDSTIQVKSEPGHGSKFYFSLPAGFKKSSTPSETYSGNN
ncbi:PAS domain-containing sensor histidine kinase [Pedobacter duraquae]|uniref:histidine kinase n=1 Tax=Pedobacter duraquae TaxID=425511 RepID=A0A4R6IF20_9SPHI|nr:ATP-binding protein [Pedobacter duraquae]TDO20268.1 phospho-acceptor domain-containing protein [Pedobacter duraquae]